MTDFYSIENYLVTEGVLESILTNEFGCFSRPEVRAPIIELFMKIYADFLDITQVHNLRILVSRKFNIAIVGGLNVKISSLANVLLDRVEASAAPPREVIRLDREPEDDELAEAEQHLAALAPRERYRGHFSLALFERWLSLLASDHRDEASRHFSEIRDRGRVREHELALNSFASKARFPEGLPQFVAAMTTR